MDADGEDVGKPEGGPAINGEDTDAPPAMVYPEPVEFATRTVLGDFRDRFLDIIRNIPDQWRKLPEASQRSISIEITDISCDALLEGFSVMHAAEFVTVGGTLKKATIEDKGIQLTLLVPRHHPNWRDLLARQGENLILILADAAKFMGESAPARIDPDQPPLPLDALKPAPDGKAMGEQAEGGGDFDPETGEVAANSEMTVEAAHELGVQARRHGVAREGNHFEFSDDKMFDAWCAGWDEESRGGEDNPQPPKRRGRPPKNNQPTA